MIKIFFALVVALSLSAKVYDGVAVVVKDKAITLLDIKKEMQLSRVDAKKASDILIRKKLEEIEIQKRGIHVSSSEVYDEIKKIASRNHMSISEFYEAVRSSAGLSSMEYKAKVKQRLLSQKLYNAISYASMDEPSEDEVKEYYELHKEDYKHPASFTVIIYQAKDRSRLEEKVNNPMFYAPDVSQSEQTLPYNRISPELARLLEHTKVDSFTSVVPDGKGGFMSFYLKEKASAAEGGLEALHDQIVNTMMGEQRERMLGDYFNRLRANADINIIRMPE